MKLFRAISAAALAIMLLGSCSRGEMGYSYTDESTRGKVLVFYAAAYNNISSYITRNVQTITKGKLPAPYGKKAVLVYCHSGIGPSYLCRLSSDEFGNAVSDTLYTIEAGRSAADAGVFAEVLGAVLDEYPQDSYSYTLILSSHGNGWYPKWAKNEESEESWDFAPRRKTFGYETIRNVNYQIEIADLADAIPMKLDCLVLDACMMGGIEVAYQLREKVVKLCCSPAEVPGNGYLYSDIDGLILSESASPESFSRAFFEYYRNALETGHPSADAMYGATSTTVDCSKLEPLAEVCRTLFEKYRSEIAALDYSDVQRYYRTDPRLTYYFDYFDLRDILLHAGITPEEDAALCAALDGCISYKGATRSFLKDYYGFDIKTFCGLSMYLPCKGNADLDAFYKTLDWNADTELVK